MVSRCEHCSSRCVDRQVGWKSGRVRYLKCLQNEMEKSLSATGKSRTRGREMESKLTPQHGAGLTQRNGSLAGWYFKYTAQMGATPHTMLLEGRLRDTVPAGTHCSQTWVNLLWPLGGASHSSPDRAAEPVRQPWRLTQGTREPSPECGSRSQACTILFLQFLMQQLILPGNTGFVLLQWPGGCIFLKWLNVILKPQKIEASWPSHLRTVASL